MLLYMSSYKIGSRADVLKDWIKKNGNKIVFIENAMDLIPETREKEESIVSNIKELNDLGFDVLRIDLKKYFGKKEKLKEDLKKYCAFYVIGGNTYILRMAMKFSGFDNYIKELSMKNGYLYAGYSAGICVLSPRLDGLDLVDEPLNIYNDEQVLYEGLEILDYIPVPHYKSNHPESKLVDKVVNLFNEKEINYKTLRDGDVIIQNTKKDTEILKKF